jgi:uncharacterized membrane protein
MRLITGHGRDGLAGRRLVVGSVVGIAAGAGTAAAGEQWQVACSVGWCALALVILVWLWATIGTKDSEATAIHARADDFSRATADIVVLGASVASLAAVAITLVLAGRAHDGRKAALIALTIITVALSWLLVHTIFIMRYGDLYYGDPVGGIDFNEDDEPDYRDFAYLALTIGMTFQVSDTNLKTKPIRHNAIRHALLSYLFGTVIVAITINIVASLLSR